mmetsp:Transcript_101818/g.294655  ORF Transcript_101818/g.294655 Transcript_101818/m.294655 type:complete len:357 (+) Transcript_101818:532-1602(+)
MPMPASLPLPMHRIWLLTPSATTAALNDSARRCESLIFGGPLLSGVPFVCPSHWMLKEGNAWRTFATLRTIAMSDMGTMAEFGSNSMLSSRASASKLLSKVFCSSVDMPDMSGIGLSAISISRRSTTNIFKPAPLPNSLPFPLQRISLEAPSIRTATRTASARACDNLRLASQFSSGLPFVCPSIRTAASGNACSTRASARITPKFDADTSCLFGSNVTPCSNICRRSSSRILKRSSCDKPVKSGISNSRSGSLARIRTHIPRPCEQPQPTHSILFSTPNAFNAEATRSARTCDNRCLLSFSSPGWPLVCPSQTMTQLGKALRTQLIRNITLLALSAMYALLGSNAKPCSKASLRS